MTGIGIIKTVERVFGCLVRWEVGDGKILEIA